MDKGIEAPVHKMKQHALEIIEAKAEGASDRTMIELYDQADELFNAENVLNLIAALEQAQTECEEFRKRLKLERQIVEDADKRIAELASSPNGMMQLSVNLQPELWEIRVPGEVAHIYVSHGPDDGDYLSDQVVGRFYSESQVLAAGGTVEGSE